MMMKSLMLILLLFPTIIYSQDILKAVQQGDVYTVKEAIKNGVNVDSRKSEGSDTPLIIASLNGNIEIVKLLLAAGADVRLTGDFEVTAVDSASGGEHWEVLALLEQAKTKYDGPLIKAIKSKNIKDINIMISENPDVNFSDVDGKSALMWASSMGNIEAVRLLVAAGASIDQRNSLYVDVDDPNATFIEGHSIYYCMEELRGIGESSYIRTYNALMWAIENDHFAVVEFLIGVGADVNMETDFESTALTLAAKNGNIYIVNLLLEQQVYIDKDDMLGNTSLILASENGHIDVVKVLIERGADFGHANNNGVTPLSAAYENYHDEIANLLTAAGATK